MEILWGAQAPPSEDRPTVVTVGMFDGVHRGHASLHGRVFERARELDARSGVVTFDPHPLEVLAPDKAPCMLTTLEQRLGLFEDAGFDLAVVLPFDAELAALSPEGFAKATLVEELHVREVVVGEDFRFGHERAGDIETLRRLGETFGFSVEAVGLLAEHGEKVSSTTIRIYLAEGRADQAATLLGRAFRLAGEVVTGDRRGRALGFPTANLKTHERACLPAVGVYAGWWLEAGRRHPGVINLGMRPTFTEADRPLCEIHLFDFDDDVYGHTGEVEFTAFLRPEQRFDGPDALVEQIRADAEAAQKLLGVWHTDGDPE